MRRRGARNGASSGDWAGTSDGAERFGDDPARSRAEDLLGRAGFAEILARALVAYPDAGSLVVALYGPWGSGKTSVLNFAFEALEAGNSGRARTGRS